MILKFFIFILQALITLSPFLVCVAILLISKKVYIRYQQNKSNPESKKYFWWTFLQSILIIISITTYIWLYQDNYWLYLFYCYIDYMLAGVMIWHLSWQFLSLLTRDKIHGIYLYAFSAFIGVSSAVIMFIYLFDYNLHITLCFFIWLAYLILEAITKVGLKPEATTISFNYYTNKVILIIILLVFWFYVAIMAEDYAPQPYRIFKSYFLTPSNEIMNLTGYGWNDSGGWSYDPCHETFLCFEYSGQIALKNTGDFRCVSNEEKNRLSKKIANSIQRRTAGYRVKLYKIIESLNKPDQITITTNYQHKNFKGVFLVNIPSIKLCFLYEMEGKFF